MLATIDSEESKLPFHIGVLYQLQFYWSRCEAGMSMHTLSDT